MRCACPHCDLYMIQAETGEPACCCTECGYRCNACMGTNTVISRDQLLSMKDLPWRDVRFENDEGKEE